MRTALKRYLLPQLKRQLNVGVENYMIPLIVGPTQCGKTRLVRELAEDLNAKLIVMLMQTEDPTDISGMVKAVQTKYGHTVTKLNPYWYQNYCEANGPVVLFFDEIDKMPSDCMASILTLLRNKSINGNVMDDVMMIAAANEFNMVDEWAPEMRARMRKLTMDYDWEWEIEHMPYHIKTLLAKRIHNVNLISPEAIRNLNEELTETPSTWWNFAQDLLDYGSDEQMLNLSFSIFHPEVAKFILNTINHPALEVTMDSEAFQDEKIRNDFNSLIMLRQLPPEVVADMTARVMKYLLKDPFPKEGTKEWKERQRAIFCMTVKTTLAAIEADRDTDKNRYSGAITDKLMSELTLEEMSRISIDPEEYQKYMTSGKDTEGIPSLSDVFQRLKK